MFAFKHGGRFAARTQFPGATRLARRCYASRIDIPFTPPPVPLIEHCPSPTCQCRPMPAMPEGLEIEREQNISSSMPAYAEHLLISTGRNDWQSRIQEEESRDGAFVRQLQGFLGQGGKFSDPYHNVMITNSSIPPTASPSDPTPSPSSDTSNNTPASAFLLPSFQYIPSIPTEPSAVEDFLKAYILPSQLHQAHDALTHEQKRVLLRQPEGQRRFPGARKVDEILILICGHGGRDERCGILGPLLRDEFEDQLQRQNIAILRDPPAPEAQAVDTEAKAYVPTARVGLISHIGGHKWAGNVIVYVPPSFSRNPLAGKGVWYGRVGPEHVEGIVGQTVMDGKVIEELFRGGIDSNREVIRL